MNGHRLWWLGGAVAAVAVLALAYFFGISPQLSQAADAQSQEVSAQGQLQQTQVQLAALKKQYDSLPQLTAELATLQQSVPGATKISDFVRQLGGQASTAQVSITTVNVGEPTAYAPTVPAGTTATAAPTATASPAPTATPAPSSTPAPNPTTAAVAPPLGSDPSITRANFVLLPVSLTATGSRDALLSFTNAVQNQGPRLFLVNKIDVKDGDSSSSAGTTGGKSASSAAPAATETLSGFIYVLVGD